MHAAQPKIAIAAALWLLVGGSIFDAAATARAAPEEAGALVGVEVVVLREWLVTELEDRNPYLRGATSQRIAEAVLRCARDQRLEPDLVLAVMMKESDARVSALSPKGAVGLMQVMPHMFERLDLPGNVAHIESNVEAGCLLLADNIRRLGEERGISAYFWGSRIRGDGYLRGVQRIRQDLARRRLRGLGSAIEPGSGRG